MPESLINPVINPDVLKCVMPRLWKPGPLAELMLALEVIDGPYKGVVFAFTEFEVTAKEPVPDGEMVPVHYATRVFQQPVGFVADEAFDKFTTDILLTWLSHASQNRESYIELAKVKTKGVH